MQFLAPYFRQRHCAATVALVTIGGAALLSGCGRSDLPRLRRETAEPAYERGVQSLRAGRPHDALASFLSAIDERPGRAPESHFECGLIYLQHKKDPVLAIYHFRRFAALQPADPKVPRVRQLIETATREFLRSLPGRPAEARLQCLDLREKVDRLEQENRDLRARLTGTGSRIPIAGDVPAPRPSWPPRIRIQPETGDEP